MDDPTEFATVPRDTPLPARFQNYRIWGDQESWLAHRDAAWEAIDDVAVVKDMSESPYPVGAYLYPPTVGAFDPDVADWVFFFFESEQ